MLVQIDLRDIVLIDRLTLDVGGGMTALTGETGAGKSIILDGLGLALGGRADKRLVRLGCDLGSVSVTFEPSDDHPVWHILKECELGEARDSIILRRVQYADGRSRAYVNDQAVSVGTLRRLGDMLLEVHGQHAGISFLKPCRHRDLLDEFAGAGAFVTKVSSAWEVWSDAKAAFADAEQRAADARARRAELEAGYEELSDLAPEAGEEDALVRERADVMAAEKVSEHLRSAAEVLNDESIVRQLSAGVRHIESAAAALAERRAGEIRPLVSDLDSVLQQIDDTQRSVAGMLADFSFDQRRLDLIEDRLCALRAASRKYRVPTDQLPELLSTMTQDLDVLERGDAHLTVLAAEAADAEAEYERCADKLSKARKRGARKLSAAVQQEFPALVLADAVFECALGQSVPGPDGIDRVEFLLSTNPGQAVAPLAAIASGGELSRVVLALRSVLSADDGRGIIVFDEADSGVGGAVADAIGERLSQLSRRTQILAITHSPQLAARAKTHWQVKKRRRRGQSQLVSSVCVLDADGRIGEIGRMLAGAKVSAAARRAAETLLKEARRNVRDARSTDKAGVPKTLA